MSAFPRLSTKAFLSEELDVLEHRRYRIQEILNGSDVSDELRTDLRKMLREIDWQVACLCADHSVQTWQPALRNAA